FSRVDLQVAQGTSNGSRQRWKHNRQWLRERRRVPHAAVSVKRARTSLPLCFSECSEGPAPRILQNKSGRRCCLEQKTGSDFSGGRTLPAIDVHHLPPRCCHPGGRDKIDRWKYRSRNYEGG